MEVLAMENGRLLFTKMHGAGNDYIYVDCTDRNNPFLWISDIPEAVRRLSHRRFGAGADGVILIYPSLKGDVRMEMYNADGTRGKMCGNGVRCVGKFVHAHGLTEKTSLQIETDSGLKRVRIKEKSVQAEMGEPLVLPGRFFVQDERGNHVLIRLVWMGNFHGVCMWQEENEEEWENGLSLQAYADRWIEELKRKIEGTACQKAMAQLHTDLSQLNFEFCRKRKDSHVSFARVLERGSGETLSCGTGACAIQASCYIEGTGAEKMEISMPGGTLQVCWKGANTTSILEGPVQTVYEGVVEKEFFTLLRKKNKII